MEYKIRKHRNDRRRKNEDKKGKRGTWKKMERTDNLKGEETTYTIKLGNIKLLTKENEDKENEKEEHEKRRKENRELKRRGNY